MNFKYERETNAYCLLCFIYLWKWIFVFFFSKSFSLFWKCIFLEFLTWNQRQSNQIANWRNTEHIRMVYHRILYPNDAHYERISGVLGNIMHLSRCMEKDVYHCPPFWDSCILFSVRFSTNRSKQDFPVDLGVRFKKQKPVDDLVPNVCVRQSLDIIV